MQLDDLIRISEAPSEDAALEQLATLVRNLGFKYYSAIRVQDDPTGPSVFVQHDNTPSEFMDAYKEPENGKKDPVMQHAKRNSLPLAWSRDYYASHGMDALWRHQAEYGYRSGIIVALHMPAGKHLVLGMNSDRDAVGTPSETFTLTSQLQMAALHLQHAFERLAPAADVPELSPRELECLKWSLQGKTAWEIGQILSVAERTIVQHLTSASKKLDASSKMHAVLKARTLDLI